MEDYFLSNKNRTHPLQENEFVGSLKAVQKARKKEKLKVPKPEEIFDMSYKEGGKVKFSKKKKEEIVMPYQQRNFKTGNMEKPKNSATYYNKRKKK